jgi:hypothetical protein
MEKMTTKEVREHNEKNKRRQEVRLSDEIKQRAKFYHGGIAEVPHSKPSSNAYGEGYDQIVWKK